jgi:hypothetical protein
MLMAGIKSILRNSGFPALHYSVCKRGKLPLFSVDFVY